MRLLYASDSAQPPLPNSPSHMGTSMSSPVTSEAATTVAADPPPVLEVPLVTSPALRKALEQDPQGPAVKALFAGLGAPVATIKKPSLWPPPPAPYTESPTSAQVLWSAEDGLLVLYRAVNPFSQPHDNPSDKLTIIRDSRVEAFIAPFDDANIADSSSSAAAAATPAPVSEPQLVKYIGVEMNRAGRCLDFITIVPRQFDYSWNSHAALLATWDEKSGGASAPLTTFMLMQLPWADYCTPTQVARIRQHAIPGGSGPDPSKFPRFFTGLYRGEALPLKPTDPPETPPKFIWQAWRDPLSPQVNFHVPESFGRVVLLPPTTVASTAAAASSSAAACGGKPDGLDDWLHLESLDSDDATPKGEQDSDVSMIVPGLFQGSMLSLSPRTLTAYGITRVVNCAAGSLRAPAECYATGSGRVELPLFLEDELDQDLFDVRPPNFTSTAEAFAPAANIVDAARWIEQARAEGHSVLVHCVQGRSRSAAIVLFHLMRTRRMHVHDALALLQRARPIVQPNMAFMTQLTRWCTAEEILPRPAAAAAVDEVQLDMEEVRIGRGVGGVGGSMKQ